VFLARSRALRFLLSPEFLHFGLIIYVDIGPRQLPSSCTHRHASLYSQNHATSVVYVGSTQGRPRSRMIIVENHRRKSFGIPRILWYRLLLYRRPSYPARNSRKCAHCPSQLSP
jgi:hypothetical protein